MALVTTSAALSGGTMRSATPSGRSSGVMKSASHTPERSGRDEACAWACAGIASSARLVARAKLAERAMRMDVLTHRQPATEASGTSTSLSAFRIDAVDVVLDHVDAFGRVRAEEAGEAFIADIDWILLEIPRRDGEIGPVPFLLLIPGGAILALGGVDL